MPSVKSQHNMNVCVIRHGYFPEDPRVLKEVRTLIDSGFSVDVICLKRKGQGRFEIIENINVYRLSHAHKRASLLMYLYEYGLSFVKMFLRLTFNHFKKHYDHIQVNTLPDPLVFLTIIPKLMGSNIVLDMHEPTPELFISKYGKNRFAFLVKVIEILEQAAIRYSDTVITVNETILETFVLRGAKRKKFVIIRNVPDESFNLIAPKQKKRNKFIIMTHGSILKRYGQEIVIHSVSTLRKKIENLQCIIAGDGEDINKVKKLSTTLGCEDIITFTGRLPFNKIIECIQGADIGVVPILPSPFAELCQPNKLFEYIANKIPVAVARYKAIEELFDDSCVSFFTPGDADGLTRSILDLYNNFDKRQELVINAYKKYEEVRWQKTKQEYVSIYNRFNNEKKENL